MSLRHGAVRRKAHRGRNPLRRRIDDVERAILLGLVVLFLLAAPLLSIVVGRASDASGLREQRAERSWQLVPATLQESAASGVIGMDGQWGASWVTASWRLPGGGQRSGFLAVGLNAQAGEKVMIWIDGAGEPARPPLSQADLADRITSAVMVVVAGLAGVFGLAALGVRLSVNRRRLAGWERDWAVAGPRWSSLR